LSPRWPIPTDRRRRAVALTERGRKVTEAAMLVAAQITRRHAGAADHGRGSAWWRGCSSNSARSGSKYQGQM